MLNLAVFIAVRFAVALLILAAVLVGERVHGR